MKTPIVLSSPLKGFWMAANSPTSKVPSHGTRYLGQTYAIDFVAIEANADWPDVDDFARFLNGCGRDDNPGYGRKICAPCSGVVVSTRAWFVELPVMTAWINIPWGLLIDNLTFFLRCPWTVGNYVMIKSGDAYILLAHLKPRSLKVRRGDFVEAGQVVGEVGHSGNSTQPHLHMQVTSVSYLPFVGWLFGVPFVFSNYIAKGGVEKINSLPANFEIVRLPGIEVNAPVAPANLR